jgi:hypothetical protein
VFLARDLVPNGTFFDPFETTVFVDATTYTTDTAPIGTLAENVRALQFIGAPCRPDVNGDGQVNVQDFLSYLSLYAAGDARADFTGDGAVNVQDFLAFLSAYAAGC